MQFDFVSRRSFLAGSSYFGTAVTLAQLIPLPALAESLAQDPRISAEPLLDKGFASVRKVGDGVYATVSDFSKGAQTLCNGGLCTAKKALCFWKDLRHRTARICKWTRCEWSRRFRCVRQ